MIFRKGSQVIINTDLTPFLTEDDTFSFPKTAATFGLIGSPFLATTAPCFIASFPPSTATFKPTPESSEIAKNLKLSKKGTFAVKLG